jgi:tetratricopeptide (TPR) repeat protein
MTISFRGKMSFSSSGMEFSNSIMEKFDGLLDQYNRSFKTNNQTLIFAGKIASLLSILYQPESPYNSYCTGTIKNEIAKCHDKLGDSVRASNEFLAAARVYADGAKFFYENSREANRLWEPLLDLSISSYSNVIQILTKKKKPSLAVQIYREISAVYEHFGYFSYAGENYRKCIDLCIENNLPSPVVFQVIFKAIHCFVKDRKIEEASNFVDHVQQLYTGSNVSDVKKSQLLIKRLQELRIYKAILNVMTFKNADERMQFSRANLEKEYTNYFEAVADTTLNNELPTLYVLVHVPVVGIELNEGHLELLHWHYLFVKEAMESSLARQDV